MQRIQIIKWLDSYEIGQPDLDYQHKHLIYLLNDTYNYFFYNEETEIKYLKIMVQHFIQYFNLHFTLEEKFMRDICYLFHKYTNHKKTHDEIRLYFDKINQKLNKGESINKYSFLTFINQFIFDHLTLQDMQIKKWLNNYKLNSEYSLYRIYSDKEVKNGVTKRSVR